MITLKVIYVSHTKFHNIWRRLGTWKHLKILIGVLGSFTTLNVSLSP